MSPTCPVLRRGNLSLKRILIRNARTCAVILGGLFLSSIANGQTTWSSVPGWPGLSGWSENFPSPELSFSASADTLTLSWAAYASNFVMESSADLSSGVWTRESDPNRIVVGDATVTTVPLESEQKYFRLRSVRTFSVPIFEFAIFYNSLLEFTWCATFTINGPVHANGDIFVGSSANLTLNSIVTTTGGIYRTNWDGHTLSQMTGAVTYNGNPASVTNAPTLELFGLPISTNDSPALTREILNLPPPGEDPYSAMGMIRYYNFARVALLVTDTNVSVYLKTSPTDAPISMTVTNYAFYRSNNIALVSTFPFLSVTNFFTDGREASKTVRTTQIDVGVYKTWLVTNVSVAAKFPQGFFIYPDTLYVADLRTIGANTNLYSIRLLNGAIIPTNGPPGSPNGWTVATPNPLYVWGHYNIGPGGTTTPGNTDTSKIYPASLVSDALTILSPNWNDANSSSSLGVRGAVNTTVNAAILTGSVYSTDATSNHFSGGVMNLPRLLEDWSGDTLTLNTSFVNLFDSARATNRFINPGIYYYAPTRAFSFDRNLTNFTKLPPATPIVRVSVPE